MITNRQPARMRALGMELAAARARMGLNTRDAAQGIGSSPATVNRSEKAKRVSPITDVAGLLALYGVTGSDRGRILELAQNLDALEWFETGDRLPWLLPFLAAFEAEARSLMEFAPAVVPGLLQTPAYVRAQHVAVGVTGADLDGMVEARLNRQKVLAKLVSPQYTAVIDEAVLRRPCGGSEVMVQQINWLIGRAKIPHINIHVIPNRHGAYPNPGMYIMMGFADAPPIAYVEHFGVAGFIDAPAGVSRFQDRTDTLMKFALGSADTVNFLTRMAADYERS
ncbi:Helix-turn-helix domain-containing protein [Actinokineospora alba]|uniref:Helix-turn-helix domain-containing protein n=1 Tax=Actinokineospora alba TaxID=504798 RepID=A0A1H0NPR1_9PSEU|nr:helix-turn-helix transcriptional regulator [Actinokineospora alba]TDP68798.1 helix-turn-helix protein [Actinokineospora alba]SDH86859.1 Helix-turn-helix domain-containing protein [Actinokineospora alba]SDO94694.1 Helix-turn-helix domain-containing protein [Actinokineospora alba]